MTAHPRSLQDLDLLLDLYLQTLKLVQIMFIDEMTLSPLGLSCYILRTILKKKIKS